MFVLAIAPRLEASSIRLERDVVGTRKRPWAEPAVHNEPSEFGKSIVRSLIIRSIQLRR